MSRIVFTVAAGSLLDAAEVEEALNKLHRVSFTFTADDNETTPPPPARRARTHITDDLAAAVKDFAAATPAATHSEIGRQYALSGSSVGRILAGTWRGRAAT